MTRPVMTPLRPRPAGRRRGTPCRRFTLLDGMILIAGAAVWFAGFRSSKSRVNWIHTARSYSDSLLMLASCLVLIFRLRRPRPPIRVLARQPGAVACFAAVASHFKSLCVALLMSLIMGDADEFSRAGSAIWHSLSSASTGPSNVVLVCWILLAASRRWLAEPGWIDRPGKVLGWLWIATGIAWPVLISIKFRIDMN